jgi:glycosyltransferase involved in cell wall biosynthesis
MPKIKILAIPSDKHGVGKYRILDPYIFIGDNFSNDFHVDISFDVPNTDESFLNYDVVVFHSFIHKTTHEENIKRINWLKNKGIKTVMDIDDYWLVDIKHPMFGHIRDNKVAEKKVEMLKLVDYVSTTTPLFADTIKKRLNVKNVEVFYNAVNPDEPQFIPNPIKSEKIRFGWLGGSSHLADLELMRDGIKTTLSNYNSKSQFVLCGFDLRGNITEIDRQTGEKRQRPIRPLETIWYSYENIFTDNYRQVDPEYKKFLLSFVREDYEATDKTYVRRWTEDIKKYAFNYNHFDVSLAPLVDNEFNTNKSQLKIIEAGFHKKAVISSEVKPYTLDLVSALDEGVLNKNGNALLVSPRRNHKDWAKHMKRLIENPNMIEDLGNRLYETVKDKYSLKSVTENRINFFKTIINN